MKALLKGVGLFVAFLLLIFSIAFLTGNFDLWYKEYFGVRQQNVETEIFKETEMYKEAKVQQLAKLRLEYIQEESESGKNAIASTIRLRHADDDASKYPEKLGEFLTEIRGY